MRTTLRRIGNSRGVLIPAALLAECGILDEIELRLEGAKIIIERVKPVREGWFDGYQTETETETEANVWASLPIEADGDEWAW